MKQDISSSRPKPQGVPFAYLQKLYKEDWEKRIQRFSSFFSAVKHTLILAKVAIGVVSTRRQGVSSAKGTPVNWLQKQINSPL